MVAEVAGQSPPRVCQVRPGCIAAVSRPLGRWGALAVPGTKHPHMGSEGGQQIGFLWRLPLPPITPSCFLLPSYESSRAIPWCLGSLHTMTEQWVQSHNSRQSVPAMSQSENKPTFWEPPPPWPFSFSSRETLRQVAWPHYVHLGGSRKGEKIQPATPPCPSSRASFSAYRSPSALLEGPKTFSSTCVRKSNILSKRNEK